VPIIATRHISPLQQLEYATGRFAS
jgi:hypothetical protein